MNILLLGGTNTGIWEGWAHHFVILADSRLGARVESGFLGAVGSLYGLFRLLKREREGVAPPDLIIFEYTLNDINLVSRFGVTNSLVRATLAEIADICRQKNITLQFLCLEPKDRRAFSPINPGQRTTRLYAELAKTYGLPAPLLLAEALGRPVQDEDYLDKDHLKPEPSRQVAEALVSRIAALANPCAPSPTPEKNRAFVYIDATQAILEGNASLTQLNKRVLQGPLIELRRPSITRWPAEGRLVGIILCSRPTSGWYELTAGDKRRRKNASVSDLSVLPEVVSLQYSGLRVAARGEIIIAMPEDQHALMRLPPDPSHMERRPDHAFERQELFIFGLMIWRGPTGLARLTEAFDHGRMTLVQQLVRLPKRLTAALDDFRVRAPRSGLRIRVNALRLRAWRRGSPGSILRPFGGA